MVRSLADRTFQLRSQRPVAGAALAGPLEGGLRPPLPAVVKIGMFMPLAEACRARRVSALWRAALTASEILERREAYEILAANFDSVLVDVNPRRRGLVRILAERFDIEAYSDFSAK